MTTSPDRLGVRHWIVVTLVTRLLPLNGVSEPQVVGNRARYPRQFAEYAAHYGVHVWSIKEWVKLGKNAPDAGLPPLDEPEKMAAWYVRTHKHRAPDNLLALAQHSEIPAKMPPAETPAAELSAAPQSPQDRLVWLRKTAPTLQDQMTSALARGDHAAAQAIGRLLLPIHEEARALENQLSTPHPAERLSPGDRKRNAALMFELKQNIKSNRESFLAGIIRKLVLAFGKIDCLPLLSDDGQASIDGAGFWCMRAEWEYARAAADVLGRFLESVENGFGILLETVQRAHPAQWDDCGALFSAIPPHLVKPLYDFAMAETNETNETQTIETESNADLR